MSNMTSLAVPHDEQPASEWASTTLSALRPAKDSSQTTDTHESAPETPGASMPGSFPVPKEGAGVTDMQYVQGVASDALKTAKQYAQTAAHGAQNAAQTAGQKVASYLSSEPGGAQKELHGGTNTLPSQETSSNSNLSSSGGAGNLPGPLGEVGVAVLPDERTGGMSVDQAVRDSNDITKSSPIMTTTNNNSISRRPSDPFERHTGYIPGVLQDDTSLAKLPEERRLENLPSHDDEAAGRLGKSGGVGALPGSANESGVALLPDERKETSGGIGGGASTGASVRRSGNTPSPLGQSHLVPQTTGRDYVLTRDEEKVFGPNAKKDLDVSEIDDDGVKREQKMVATSTTSSDDAPDAHAVAGDPKKSGFMHKVKGEMKIISGKMTHNETKIEEGRKMMGKN